MPLQYIVSYAQIELWETWENNVLATHCFYWLCFLKIFWRKRAFLSVIKKNKQMTLICSIVEEILVLSLCNQVEYLKILKVKAAIQRQLGFNLQMSAVTFLDKGLLLLKERIVPTPYKDYRSNHSCFLNY